MIGSDLINSLLVKPEALVSKAVIVEQKVQKMQEIFEDLDTVVEKTSHYWVGEAADVHRECFISEKPEIEEILKRLMEHSKDLHQMASVYITAEQEVTEILEDLPADVII